MAAFNLSSALHKPGVVTHEVPEYEFGTNTGRQGTFNPRSRSQRQQALARLDELQQGYGDTLDFNFTGMTGLAPGDATGYSKMLNARTEAANISRILGGGKPLNTRFGGVLPPPQGQTMPRPRYNPSLGKSVGYGGYPRPVGSPIVGDGVEVPTEAAPWSLGGPGSAVRGTSVLGANRTMYGADAAADRKTRELALTGLDNAMQQEREAGDPFDIRQQRSNIQQHGTIETPQDYGRRMGREDVAESMDPASPIGQRDELEYQRKMGEAEARYGMPARIRSEAQLGSARLGAASRSDAARVGAESRLGAAGIGAAGRGRNTALQVFSRMLSIPREDLSPQEQDQYDLIMSQLEEDLGIGLDDGEGYEEF